MFDVTMPKPGQTVEEGVLVDWLKSEGQKVAKGDILAEIETDKVVFELESPADGVLLKTLFAEGDAVPVHALMAVIGEPGEDVDGHITALRSGATAAAVTATTRSVAPATPSAVTPAAPATDVKAAPAARKAAQEAGIDLTAIGHGSGPGGMITTADVARAVAAKNQAHAAPAGAIRKPLSKSRRAIAQNLAHSKSTVPHFYMRATVDASALEAFYAAGQSACTINDIILLACGRAMQEFPQFRSRYEDGDAVEFASSNIGIAVASEAGLVVPVIEGVEGMKLEELAVRSRQVVQDARAGRLAGVSRGTLTISNLGMFGVEEFAAIINPPESAILAVGAIHDAAVVTGNQVRPGRILHIVLSSDHRVVDGVAAAKFIAKMKSLLESPESL